MSSNGSGDGQVVRIPSDDEDAERNEEIKQIELLLEQRKKRAESEKQKEKLMLEKEVNSQKEIAMLKEALEKQQEEKVSAAVELKKFQDAAEKEKVSAAAELKKIQDAAETEKVSAAAELKKIQDAAETEKGEFEKKIAQQDKELKTLQAQKKVADANLVKMTKEKKNEFERAEELSKQLTEFNKAIKAREDLVQKQKEYIHDFYHNFPGTPAENHGKGSASRERGENNRLPVKRSNAGAIVRDSETNSDDDSLEDGSESRRGRDSSHTDDGLFEFEDEMRDQLEELAGPSSATNGKRKRVEKQFSKGNAEGIVEDQSKEGRMTCTLETVPADDIPNQVKNSLRDYYDEEGNPIFDKKKVTGRSSGASRKKSAIPSKLSLLAKLNMDTTTTSEELLSRCQAKIDNPESSNDIFEQNLVAPTPPIRSDVINEDLHPKVPVITIGQARSKELAHVVQNNTIILMRGADESYQVVLDEFSSRILAEKNPDHKISTSHQQPKWVSGDLPSSWKFSEKKWVQRNSTISEYAEYQTDQEGLTGQCSSSTQIENIVLDKYGMIHLASNIDIDDIQFPDQMKEIYKLAEFLQPNAPNDLLNIMGEMVQGLNIPQAYMKTLGCRTSGHHENMCLSSLNLNVGPADCEWHAVAYQYLGEMKKMCEERGIDFYSPKQGWWPNIDDLIKAKIPVYRFKQKKGEIVYVGPGCVHWVESLGQCNNFSWNLAPLTYEQLAISTHHYEWNKTLKIHSFVPMQQLYWNIARKNEVSDQKVFFFIRGMLMRMLAHYTLLTAWAKKKHMKFDPSLLDKLGKSSKICHKCKAEVYNVLFIKKGRGRRVACAQCANAKLNSYNAVLQYTSCELSAILDNFKMKLEPTNDIAE